MSADALVILPTLGRRIVEAMDKALRGLLDVAGGLVDVRIVIDEAGAGDIPASGCLSFDARPERRGIVGAYNAGLGYFHQHPEYQFCWFLEDAMTVRRGLYEAMRTTLTTHPTFGWVGASQEENRRAIFSAMCSMFTREAVTALGYLDLAFAPYHFDDGDVLYTLRSKGFAPHGIAAPRVSHPESRTATRDDGKFWNEAVYLAHEWLFKQKWGAVVDWGSVPVHDPATCRACQVVVAA